MTPRRETKTFTLENMQKEDSYNYAVTYIPQSKTKIFWFSPKELKHLIISTLLVTGVGLSIFVRGSGIMGLPSGGPEILISLAVIFTLVYLLHELAHKFVAQHYGLWAEFRLTVFGALITLISIFSPIKFISPGAVLIAGPLSREIAGRTALAGPLTNIILSFVGLPFALFPISPSLGIIAVLGTAFNAWIALFNLVPFAIMDGLKVFRWNRLVWAAVFSAALGVTVITFLMLWC